MLLVNGFVTYYVQRGTNQTPNLFGALLVDISLFLPQSVLDVQPTISTECGEQGSVSISRTRAQMGLLHLK